jgi:predicted ABC-type ATPase
MKTLYLLAGCNGAGKTTAAFTLLPGLLAYREFVNSAIKPFAYLRR